MKSLVALALLLAPLPAMAKPASPYTPESFEGIKHPAWSRKAVIARMVHVKNSAAQKIFSFVRAKDGDAVFVAQNYSAEAQTVTLEEIPHPGRWTEKGGTTIALAKGGSLTIAPWSTRIFTRAY